MAQIHAVGHKFVLYNKIRTISIFCRPTRHALGKQFFFVGRHLSLPYCKLMLYGTSKNAVLCKQNFHLPFLRRLASLEPFDDAAERTRLPEQPHRVEPTRQSAGRQICQADG
jgi:hypothetical protein